MNSRFLTQLLSIILLILTGVGCAELGQSPSLTPTLLLQGFGVEYRPELLISVKWGLGPDEMPPLLTLRHYSDTACCSGYTPEILRSRANFLHYIDENFYFYVLTVDSTNIVPSPAKFDLLKFSPDGSLEKRYHLINTDLHIVQYHILGFAVKDQNVYLYESTGERKGEYLRIRKVALKESHRNDIWQIRLDHDFKRDGESYPEKIYISSDSRIYLGNNAGRVLEIDSETGQILKRFFLDQEVRSDPILSRNGSLYSLNENDRLMECSIPTGQCILQPDDGPTTLFRSLLGADENNNVYDYTNRIGILAPDGRYLAQFPIPDIVVKNASEIYFGFWDSENQEILVRHWDQAKQLVDDIRLSLLVKKDSRPEFLQVTKEGYFVYYYGNFTLYHYDLTGKLVESRQMKGEKASITAYNQAEMLFTLQSRSYWPIQMDRLGRLYLTITDPEGFKVVRLNLVLPEEEAK